MDTLISDGGKYEISKRVTDLLRSLFIQDYHSEPYHQHQNKAENRFGLAKRLTENAQKGYLVDCPKDVPYTALTIVCTINVSIDCNCFDVSNSPTRKNIHKRKSSQ